MEIAPRTPRRLLPPRTRQTHPAFRTLQSAMANGLCSWIFQTRILLRSCLMLRTTSWTLSPMVTPTCGRSGAMPQWHGLRIQTCPKVRCGLSRHTSATTEAEDAAQRVAGLVFYPDEDGLGGSNDGLDFGFGLNDWNNRGVEAQGFGGTEVGDSGLQFISAQDDIGNPSAAFLRIEIVEGGDTDEYTLFYKLEEADDWTELATVNSDQDNSRVAMFIKTGGNTAAEDRSVSFTYFSVDDGSTENFRITAINRTIEGVTLTWSSRPGVEYSLDSNTGPRREWLVGN